MSAHAVTISKQTARRLLLSLQGVWPSHRWSGPGGVLEALESLGSLQMDPLTIVARSHDLVLWNRVSEYRTDYLTTAAYEDRRLFEYGGVLSMHPIEHLPHWLHHMNARQREQKYIDAIGALGDDVDRILALIQREGPLSAKQVALQLGAPGESRRPKEPNQPGGSYRSQSPIGKGMYHLWLGGMLMTHHRDGFERIYDLPDNVAPKDCLIASSKVDAEAFFASMALRRSVLSTLGRFRSYLSYYLQRPIAKSDAQAIMDRMQEQGDAVSVEIEEIRGPWFLAAAAHERVPGLRLNSAERSRQVRLLSPLDPIVDRERARIFFDFDHVWEIYKPAVKRRWGPFTMPILYGELLVGRIDARVERRESTLHINGIWLEREGIANDREFVSGLEQAIADLARFAAANEVRIHQTDPAELNLPAFA